MVIKDIIAAPSSLIWHNASLAALFKDAEKLLKLIGEGAGQGDWGPGSGVCQL